MKLSLLSFRSPEELISEPKNDEELWRDVRGYLDTHGFYGHCTRHWVENERLIIDFGHHTQLFAVENMTVKDMKDLLMEV